jgi:hypothetical protein
MKIKESINLVGNLCIYNDILVLVISNHSDNRECMKKESYYVLFPQGGIDTVSKESLKVIC